MNDVVDVVFVVTSGPRLLWNFVKIETDTTIAAYELMVVSNGSYVCNGGQRTFSMVRTDFFSVSTVSFCFFGNKCGTLCTVYCT